MLIIGLPLWLPYVVSLFRWKYPLFIVYFYLKDPILIVVSKTLDGDVDFVHCDAGSVSGSIWKQRYSSPYGGSLILLPRVF